MRQVRRATPGIRYTVAGRAERDDTLRVRLRAQGTNTGPFMGPPSGRPVDITVLAVVRVVDGRIVEHRRVPNRFAPLTQTGSTGRVRRRPRADGVSPPGRGSPASRQRLDTGRACRRAPLSWATTPRRVPRRPGGGRPAEKERTPR
ncbi:ester cyclase [Georgenia yuyongxinii]|nr:ester cyclase [Georgenia yuyongxinii]